MKLILAVLFRGLGFLVAFIFSFIIAKSLSQSEAGVFFWLLAIVSVLTTLGGMGVGQLVVRYSASYKASGDLEEYQFKAALITLGCIGALIVSLVAFFSVGLLEEKYQSSMSMMAPSIFFIGVATLYAYSLQGQGFVKIAITFLTIVVPLGTVLMAFSADTSFDFSLIRTILGVISMLLVIYIYRKLGNGIKYSLLSTEIISAFKMSSPLLIVAFASMVIQWGGQIYTGAQYSSEDVATMAISQRLAMLVSVVLIGVNLFLSPKFATEFRLNGVSTKLLKLFRLGIVCSLVPAVIASVFIMLFSKDILVYLSPEYKEGSLLVIIFLTGQVINSSTGPVADLLNMTGRERLYRNNMLVCALLFFPSVVWLSNQFDIQGVAMAVALCLITQNILNFICVLRIFRITLFDFIFSGKPSQ